MQRLQSWQPFSVAFFHVSVSSWVFSSDCACIDIAPAQARVTGWFKLMQVNNHLWYQSNSDPSHQPLLLLIIELCSRNWRLSSNSVPTEIKREGSSMNIKSKTKWNRLRKVMQQIPTYQTIWWYIWDIWAATFNVSIIGNGITVPVCLAFLFLASLYVAFFKQYHTIMQFNSATFSDPNCA